MVARPTPDRKVASSNLAGIISFCRDQVFSFAGAAVHSAVFVKEHFSFAFCLLSFLGGAQHCLSRPKHGEITASLRLDAKVIIWPPDWSTGSARHCPNTAARGAAGSDVHCL